MERGQGSLDSGFQFGLVSYHGARVTDEDPRVLREEGKGVWGESEGKRGK